MRRKNERLEGLNGRGPWNRSVAPWGVAFATALAFISGVPLLAWAAEKEKAATAKVEMIGGGIAKNEQGKVVQLLLYEKSILPAPPRLTDEGIEAIDFSAFTHVTNLSVLAPGITDRSLLQFGKIPTQLHSVYLYSEKTTVKGLAQFLKQQQSLYSLSLGGTCADELALPEIAKMKSLRILALSGARITDKGVRELVNSEQLALLSLTGTDLSDTGLADIGRMANLYSLAILRTKVTDKGLEQLGDLSRLRMLDVSATKVTKEGIKALQKRLPKLKITQVPDTEEC